MKKHLILEHKKKSQTNPSGWRPRTMYGLDKVHKIATDGLPLLDLFCLITNTQTYKVFSFNTKIPNDYGEHY